MTNPVVGPCILFMGFSAVIGNRFALRAILLFAFVTIPRSSHAEDNKVRNHLMIADATSYALLGSGLVLAVDSLFGSDDLVDHLDLAIGMTVLGAAGYFFAAPLVHAAHDRPLRGVASLGLRLALPVTGIVIAEAVADSPGTGFAIGILSAHLLDWFVLGDYSSESASGTKMMTMGMSF